MNSLEPQQAQLKKRTQVKDCVSFSAREWSWNHSKKALRNVFKLNNYSHFLSLNIENDFWNLDSNLVSNELKIKELHRFTYLWNE